MTNALALLICAAAAGFEGLCAGRDPLAQLRALIQPRWSPPGWAWVLIGIAWYAICFVALVRLLPSWAEAPLPVVLLVLLMLANGAANLVQFRMRRLDLLLWYFAAYALLLAVFLWVVCPVDRLVCALFAVYALYLPFAGAWGWALHRMNSREP